MKKIFAILVMIVFVGVLVACNQTSGASNDNTIKIGIIADLSGSGSTLGPGAVNAAELAVEEINAGGGVLGKEVELITGDSASDAKTANDQAKTILNKNKADALFLMSNSANREAMMSTVEKSNKLFFYTPIYEGGSYGDNMYFSGEVPSQQIEPVIPHIMETYEAKKWFIVGNDYVWARKTSEILKGAVEGNGGEIVGEEYVPMGTSDFSTIISNIQSADPDFISVEVVGADAISFVKQLESMGLDKGLFAYNVDEDSIKAMGKGAVGMLEAASYFYNLDTEANKEYLKNYTEKFGEDAVRPNFVSNSPYEPIHIWAKAVNEAGNLEVKEVNEALPTVTFSGPKGEVSFDGEGHHASLPIFLGEVGDDLEVTIVKEFGIIEP
ncbi:substrate-binding protein [Aquibacillus koreensis]|uniref:Substrate-binding protein n=1 Tax=Aquibacillus koreensis TaxID=279446 RepID=A0A9X3WJ38_9BACI|nr:substrate-binding protein [Aquibacillus koreensis]MCT2537154.1 substrate-binding protein [Aquibacillus koreensis]MDC3419863.1 substrate-binding protein [Aquibacillus koreensis]